MTKNSIVSKKVHIGDNKFSEVSVEYADGKIVALEYEFYQKSYAQKDIEAFMRIHTNKVLLSENYQAFLNSQSVTRLSLMERAFNPFMEHMPENMRNIINKYNNKVTA